MRRIYEAKITVEKQSPYCRSLTTSEVVPYFIEADTPYQAWSFFDAEGAKDFLAFDSNRIRIINFEISGTFQVEDILMKK